MADDAPAPTIPSRPRWTLVRRVEFFGFAALVLVGLVFYLWWGFSFGVWLDNGVYAVVIVFELFGLAGMWLVLPNPPVASPHPS
jgi:hypothetical protein